MADWTIQQARDTYNIAHWGGGYFDVNDSGHMVAYPDRQSDKQGIDLYELSASRLRNFPVARSMAVNV